MPMIKLEETLLVECSVCGELLNQNLCIMEWRHWPANMWVMKVPLCKKCTKDKQEDKNE